MIESILAEDGIIYHEMMAHLPLFAHPKPRQVAILHDRTKLIAHEIQKHPAIQPIIHGDHIDALSNIAANSLDVLIIADNIKTDNYVKHFQMLHTNGILMQQSETPFDLTTLKYIQQTLRSAGFYDIHAIQFPQPSFTSGWRAAVLAVKYGTLKRPREKDIFNKSFSTRFYNLDVHKAAFALPEFMRVELISD